MTTIKTNHGEYKGKTVESIIRRWYGRKAWVNWAMDPNSPQAGDIVRTAKDRQGMHVLGTLYWWEGNREPGANHSAVGGYSSDGDVASRADRAVVA